ncbi:MAG TPA: YkvA family protein [Deinococcales bacterium]|nr:YkvA family protein [Deinococcales bacterium]
MDPTPGHRALQALENPDIQDRIRAGGGEDRIREGFQDVATKVRERVGDLWDDLHDAYSMVFDRDFDVKGSTRAIMLGALAYLVSPVDLLSDAIPLLGFADDLAVVSIALRASRPEIERYRAWKAARAKDSEQ